MVEKCMPLETLPFSKECQTMIPSSIMTLMMNNQSKAGLGKPSPAQTVDKVALEFTFQSNFSFMK